MHTIFIDGSQGTMGLRIVQKKAKEFFDKLYEQRDDNFGNGREVRNRFEDMIVRQSNRVAAMESPSKEDLMAVLPEDLEDNEEKEAE